MRSLEQVNIRTNVRTYVLTYIRTGQTLYPLHNFVVRGDNEVVSFEQPGPYVWKYMHYQLQVVSIHYKHRVSQIWNFPFNMEFRKY